jgi:hypothetical protein
LRAGLLSQQQIIDEVNSKFVSTWIIIDDASKLAQKGDELGRTLASNWEYPIDIMFLTPEGKLMNKLNSYRDLTEVHPDVASPPGKQRPADGMARRSNVDVFLSHVTSVLSRN